MKYSANYSVNNGTRLIEDLESYSLRKIISEIKCLAAAEMFQNSEGTVTVCDALGNIIYYAYKKGHNRNWQTIIRDEDIR